MAIHSENAPDNSRTRMWLWILAALVLAAVLYTAYENYSMTGDYITPAGTGTAESYPQNQNQNP